MRPIVLASIVLALALSQPAAAAGPTCALLDPEKAPRATILEAKLVADGSATWVERADIDKVLQEQKLQALFSPQSVAERVKLGRLLKADLLVMVRTAKGVKEPVLEVVVSEAATGLRLVRRAVPVTRSADEDVAALLAAVHAGIKKFGEAVTEVVAVPPFVSNDLGYQFDHLKAAHARLAESVAMDRKGVAAVELEEAQALAKEMALTAPGAKLVRPLPLYLLGEYRHDGKDKDRTVSLKLRAERDGKLVGRAVELKLKPDEAPAAIRKWAATVLEGGNAPLALPNPKSEAAVLAARARDFERLGNGEEALALIEASLLLDPDQPALWTAALRNLTPLIQRSWSPKDLKLELAARVRPMYLRGLTHLDALTADEDLRHYRAPNVTVLAAQFLSAPNGLQAWGQLAPATTEIITELQQARRDRMVRLIPRLVKLGNGADIALAGWIGIGLAPKEKYELVERLLVQLQDEPNAQGRTVSYGTVNRPHVLSHLTPPVSAAEDAAYRAFLGRLAAAKSAELRAGAAALTRQWDAERAALKDVRKPLPEPEDVQGLTFRPIEFTHGGRTGSAFPYSGILGAGTGTDVVWGGRVLGVMKERGKCRTVWTGADAGTEFSTVVFDGRYVWATARRTKKWPLLVVLDPVSEKVQVVSAAEGLPEGTDEQLKEPALRHMGIAALEPGKICAAGSFGRGWIALVTLDPKTAKPVVKVIHEAREVQDPGDKDQGARTGIDFLPDFMFTVRAPAEQPGGEPGRRVLVGRGLPVTGYGRPNPAVVARPLVVDPDRSTVEVLREPMANLPRLPHCFGVAGDAVYYLPWDPTKAPQSGVVRIGLPDLTPKVVVEGLPVGFGQVFIHDGRLHVVREIPSQPIPGGAVITADRIAREWWTADLSGKNLRLEAKDVPYLRAVSTSSHYGLVGIISPGGPAQSLYTIEFTRSKK